MFIVKGQSLYRRDELFIRCGFDTDSSENSINPSFMILKKFQNIVDEDDDLRTSYTPDPNTMAYYGRHRLSNGSYYWSLTMNGGWIELYIDPEHNPYTLCEVSYDYSNQGTGQLDIWLNGIFVEARKGPSSWRCSEPHKAINDIRLRCRQRNFGVSDPPGRAELDNLLVYKYVDLNIEIFNYNPPKASSEYTSIETLRGSRVFQTSKVIGADIEMTLRFFSAEEHTSFIANIDKPHVFCDEKYIFYRGAIKLQECKKIGIDLYEQSIIFESVNKLGVGWI
jgi:hypothetical protein